MKIDHASPDAPAFISLSDYEEFQKPDRFIERTLLEAPLESGRTKVWQVKLDFHLKSQLREILGEGATSFSSSCITVTDDDGMSWSAEAVNALAAREFPQFTRRCLSNSLTTDSLPVIANFVGLNSFLGLAAKHKLTQSPFSFLTLRRSMTPLIVICAVLVGSAVKVLEIVQKARFPGAGQTIGRLFSDWSFYAINFALAMLGLVSQNLAARYATNPKSKAIEKLVERLQLSDVVQTRDFDAFVDGLARQMQAKDFPRIVIIDNFSSLDETTKRVIARYFRKYSERARGEFWIIFQGSEGARFSTLAVEHPSGHGFRRTQFFDQMLFSEEEKRQLITVAGRPEDALVYVTAKRIAHAKAQGDQDVAALFTKDRADHPRKKTYSALDFLYLLSLTADRVFLTQKFMTNNLSVKSGLRAQILTQFLYGTRLRVEEFRTAWSDIQQRFRSMLITEPDADSLKLRVIPEKTNVLAEMADKLDLPDLKLGHLFWSLFWFDKLQNHPVQAVWMRKLSTHLLQADASAIEDEETYIAVLNRLFSAILFNVDGLLKTCLFPQIARLLETALNLARGDLARIDHERKLLFRLLAKCWEAYSVLGSEEILRLILEIYETTPPQALRSTTEDQRLLEAIFFESIALPPDKRRRLKPNFFTRSDAPAVINETMSDYACVRAAWLTLAASRHVESDVNKFYTALIFADARVPVIWERSFARINNPSEESIRLTDIMTLSLSLWCRALRFNPLILQTRVVAGLFSKSTTSGDVPQKELTREAAVVSRTISGDLPALIAAAEEAVLLAAELSRGGTKRSGFADGADYLMKGFAKELCALALASVLMANKYSEGLLLDQTQLERINDLIRISNDFLEYSLPLVSNAEELFTTELVRKVESLMKVCGLIWNEFGLDRLRDFVNIRRIHFHAVCTPHAPDDFPAYNSLLNSLGPLLQERDFGGVMANLAISESLSSMEELETYYLIHAAQLSLSDSFGQNVRNQLCLAAILVGHSFSYPVDPFIEHLIFERADLASLLLRFLKSVPEYGLEIETLKLINISKLATKPESGARIIEIVTAFAETIQSPDMKTQVQALLDTFAMEQQIKKGVSVDVPKLLGTWSTRKDLWLYPGLLNELFANGYGSAEIKDDALVLLQDREPALDTYNTYFLLSITLSHYLATEKSERAEQLIAAQYLEKSIGKWRQSSADTKLRAYQILYRLDPAAGKKYLAEIQNCHLIIIERDHLKRLPQLLAHGQLFLVFQYYFEVMQFWGLGTDISGEELEKQVNIPPDEKRARAREWLKSDAVIPQPLIGRGASAVVASKFLALGSYLFSAPNSADPTFDHQRQAFNGYAKSHVPELFLLILALPDLPVPVKDLFRSHSQRLQSYTLPIE